MNHKLFSTLAVAAALGACSGKKDPAAPVVSADGKEGSALQADAGALPNLDGTWTAVKIGCGEQFIDFTNLEKSNPSIDSQTTEFGSESIEIKGDSMVSTSTSKWTREDEKTLEGVTTGPVKVKVDVESVTVSRTRIEKRDAKTMHLSTTSRTTQWETINGERKKMSSKKEKDEEAPDVSEYSLKGDELKISYTLNPEDAAETPFCTDDTGKVLSNEIYTVMKRVK